MRVAWQEHAQRLYARGVALGGRGFDGFGLYGAAGMGPTLRVSAWVRQ